VTLDRPWQRLAGLAVVLACLALYEPGSPSIVHRLVYPLLMAAGTWALVQNVTVVALAGTFLAAVHSDLGADDWVYRFAYPALTATGAMILLGVGVRRFRRRIAETHEARWSERRSP
jgi:hypothetical protein